MKFFIILTYLGITLADVSHLFNNNGYNYRIPQQVFESDSIIQPPQLPEIENLPARQPLQPPPIQFPNFIEQSPPPQSVQFPNFIETVTPSAPPPPPQQPSIPTYVSPSPPPPAIYNIPSGIESPQYTPPQTSEYLPPPPPPSPPQIQSVTPLSVIQENPIRIPIQADIRQQIQTQEPVFRPQIQEIPQPVPSGPSLINSNPIYNVPRPQQEYLPPTVSISRPAVSVQRVIQPTPIIFKSQPAPFSVPSPTPIPQFIASPSPQPAFQPIQQFVSQPRNVGYNYDIPNRSFFS